MDGSQTYAQDFFPIIEEKFPLGKTYISEVLATLESYRYIEPPINYKFLFRFGDNVNSQVFFYFDQNRILGNLAFVDRFAPTPIDPKILSDLCRQLSIDSNSEKCKPNALVYTTDIAREIRTAFPRGISTYDDVQAKIGKYQVKFDAPVRDATGSAVTLSWYDFVGNNFTRIRFDFDTNFVVRSIQFFSGGS